MRDETRCYHDARTAAFSLPGSSVMLKSRRSLSDPNQATSPTSMASLCNRAKDLKASRSFTIPCSQAHATSGTLVCN